MFSRLDLNAESDDNVGQNEFVESELLSSCNSCKDDGQTVAAARYCVDCEEYQCNKCLKSHDRYNKGHEVYDASSRQKWGTKKPVKLPTGSCPTHVGEVLQLYCEDHDAVCCHVCIAMHHSTCERKQYIPEVAKNITKGNKEFDNLYETLDKIRTHIQTVIDDSKQNKESITMSREKFKKLLQETRQRFESLYTKLEQTSYAELGQSHDIMDAEVDRTIQSSNILLTEVKCLHERINPDIHTNESQLYINMKQVNGKMTEVLQQVERVSQPQPTGIECQASPEIYRFLNITESTNIQIFKYDAIPTRLHNMNTIGCVNLGIISPREQEDPDITKGILTSERTYSEGTPTHNLQNERLYLQNEREEMMLSKKQRRKKSDSESSSNKFETNTPNRCRYFLRKTQAT